MKRCLPFIIALCFLLSSRLTMVAQNKVEEIKISEVSATAIGSENETIEQVSQRAINEAKAEALKRAGIEENIASFTDYFQKEGNDKYEDLFTSDFLSDIRGAVKNVEVVSTKKSFDDFGHLKIDVLINCTVVKYLTEKDLTFDAWVEGVGMFYQNETNLLFKVKVSKNSYLKIFIFGETEAFQLFPNKEESSFLLNANVQYDFPSKLTDYELYTDKKSEMHRMVMVFMKKDIPYTDEVNYKKIIDWIFSIPPDIRVIKSFSFNVVNEIK